MEPLNQQPENSPLPDNGDASNNPPEPLQNQPQPLPPQDPQVSIPPQPPVNPQTIPETQIPSVEKSMNGGAPKPKSKKGLIIGLIIGGVVLALIILGVFAALVLSSVSNVQDRAKKASDKAQSTKKSDSKDNAVTAKYATDYDAVCDGGLVTNAPQPVKPYKIDTFYTNDTKINGSWVSLSLGFGESYHPDSTNPVSANVVACLTQKEGTEKKSKTCDFKGSNSEVLKLDYYSVEYELVYKEALTGKTIGVPSTINGPATKCPIFASYNKADPKLYGEPDKPALEVSHKALAN